MSGRSGRCSASRCCEGRRRSASSPSTRLEVRPFTDKQIELVDDLRRPGGDRDRERAAVRRNPGQEPPARRGEPAQVAVPRQHEPRAAHAAQRHPRAHRDDGHQRGALRHGEDAGAAAARESRRQPPARPDQRGARPLQDRGRQARAQSADGAACAADRRGRSAPRASSPSRTRTGWWSRRRRTSAP